MEKVYILWHTHADDKYADEAKLIGVYRTQIDAQPAIERVGKQPGFRDNPTRFQIEAYELNKDFWTEGFINSDQI